MNELLGFLAVLSTLLSGHVGIPVASASSGDALTGYAWSETVGWQSFNCTDTSSCATGPYGVTVSAGSPTRLISGYAWSENIGWVTFNESDMVSDCPTGAGTCKAELDISTSKVSGWARACSVYATGCSGALASSGLNGGWDGWIKLRDSSYGILANGGKWTGYAWGGGGSGTTDGVIGWLTFRGFTSESPPQVYGVNATSNGVSNQVISCGVNKQTALTSESVTWTVVYDSSVVTPAASNPFTWTSLTSNTFTPAETDATQAYAYTTAGLKKAAVTMTTNTGEVYVVDCDGISVNGVSPGYPSVTVGAFDLSAPTAPGLSHGNPNMGEPHQMDGQYDYTGPAVTFPFPITTRFEFDRIGFGGAVDEYSTPSDHIKYTFALNEVSNDVTLYWTPLNQGNYRFRICTDTLSALTETNESNNCSGWSSSFTVEAPLPTGMCDVSPRLSRPDGTVTWTVNPSGGDGSYQYDWTFTGGATFVGGTDKSDQSPQVKYATGGTKTATVRIQSNGEQKDVSCSTNGGARVRVQVIQEI